MCTPHYRVHRNRIVSLPDARRVPLGAVAAENIQLNSWKERSAKVQASAE
jgi:hypothetical protein